MKTNFIQNICQVVRISLFKINPILNTTRRCTFLIAFRKFPNKNVSELVELEFGSK
jgi:hypothetical protein